MTSLGSFRDGFEDFDELSEGSFNCTGKEDLAYCDGNGCTIALVLLCPPFCPVLEFWLLFFPLWELALRTDILPGEARDFDTGLICESLSWLGRYARIRLSLLGSVWGLSRSFAIVGILGLAEGFYSECLVCCCNTGESCRVVADVLAGFLTSDLI